MITLSPITTDDITEIKTWPPYKNGFAQMDYAVRDDGWLDEFTNRPNTWIYAALFENRTAGFSLLSCPVGGIAEFRIAVHPRLTGRGIGRKIAQATLETGFGKLHRVRIYLIVRKNNHPAMNLYESLGFKKIRESIHTIQGQPIDFFDMDITREDFFRINIKEAP